MTINIGGFIKIGAEEHVLDLYENGTIYCNTIQFFREQDEKDGRGDTYEGISHLTQLDNITHIDIQVKDQSKAPIRLQTVGPLQLKEFDKDLQCNLYSLYSIDTDQVLQTGIGRVDPEYKKLGSHFLIIHQTQRFLDLVVGELNVRGYRFRHGPVTFYDEKTFRGGLTPFSKRNKFKYQSEFRFVINNTVQAPLVIRVGSLKNLALLFESRKLDDMEFRPMNKTSDYEA